MDELSRITSSGRLVTLVGPGGCGKTRLAIETASRVKSTFPGGVAFVDLAPNRDHATVPEAVAAGLGFSRQAWADVPELIGESRMLLVLDNAEHLLEGVSLLVEEFLRRCPALGIMVTSREPLNLDGELSWRVPPLRLPPADAFQPLDQLAGYDAVRLFTTRAAEHGADFRLTVENATLVGDICRRLDGIPLALELAAARVPTLGLTEVASRLGDSYHLLTRGSRTAVDRHRTLRAAVDWSYQLLDDSGKRLFRRISVFSGSFDLKGAEAVCSDEQLPAEQIVDGVDRLVNKSLVLAQGHPDGHLTYSVMEVLRQYGQEQMLQAHDTDVRARHARYYAGLVGRLNAVRDRKCMDRLSEEYENIRSALEWMAAEDSQLLAVTVNSLHWWWRLRGSIREAYQWSLRALDQGTSSPNERVLLHRNASVWLRMTGRPQEACDQIDQAMCFLKRVDNVQVSNRIIGARAVLRAVTGNWAAAEQDFNQAVSMLDGMPFSEELVISLSDRAMFNVFRGRPELALRDVERVELLAPQMSGGILYPECLHTAGTAYLALRQVTAARDRFLRGLELAATYRNHKIAVALLQGLACCAADTGRAELCLELVAAARACARMAGITDAPAEGTPCTKAERASHAALGDRVGDEAIARGLRMDLQEALQRARSEISDGDGESPITRRKLQIVRMVAQGLANKEIADRLSISERTVEAHLEQLRNQLGFRNRAQIAAWAASKGLVSQVADG